VTLAGTPRGGARYRWLILKATGTAVAAGLSLASPSLANDSTAELGMGGLQLVRNDVVELLSEDLFVSAREVRVNYRFRNKTERAANYLVAFPLPPIDAALRDELNIVLPSPADENFVDFRVSVDGQMLTPSLFQRVSSLGVDRTAEIAALGLPLNPRADGILERLKALPREKRLELHRLGLVTVEGENIDPTWKLETTFYWQQSFPPKQEVVVDHQYRPVVGFAFFGINSLDERNYRGRYCFDDAFLRTARTRLSAVRGSANPYLDEERISYVLTTARNWASPIKSFRLVVDKGEADALLSFCGKGVKRLSPTQFEMTAKDFTPDRELDILIARTHRQR
jgi:hypothetical protein